MTRFLKQTILFSSVVILIVLALDTWRENLSMDWQKYQHKYNEELFHRAQSEQEQAMAHEYEIKMRQIMVPESNSFDRCITCHVAVEDSRMTDMPNPLKAHPGDYLNTHDVDKVGCTSCHDGQGSAVTFEDAHAKGIDKFWEKPLLKKPFIEATCARCHSDPLDQTPVYNLGKQLFQQNACFACHSVGDIGGVQGPALSDIGQASFHMKMPIPENRKKLLEKFDQNVNLAYLYESITEPDAQPAETLMKKVEMTEDEVIALMVYLKSLSSKRRVMDIGSVSNAQAGRSAVVIPVKKVSVAPTTTVTGGGSEGSLVFSRACIACHTIGKGDTVGPDLQGVTARRNREWLKSFIQYPSKMIEAKDPLVMELLQKYKTPMVDMGLTKVQVEAVIRYLENPNDVSVPASPAGSEVLSEQPEAGQKTITPAEIAKGAALFQGNQRFLNRGAACTSCHDVRNDQIWSGGFLASDLTDAYSRLGGIVISAILEDHPFPVMQAAYKDKPLTADEISALTAFLENAAGEEASRKGSSAQTKMFFAGVVGLLALLVFYCVFWGNRKKRPVNETIYGRQKKSEDEI